jgi:hypothetical protein
LKVIIMDHSRRKIAGSCIITVGIMLRHSLQYLVHESAMSVP